MKKALVLLAGLVFLSCAMPAQQLVSQDQSRSSLSQWTTDKDISAFFEFLKGYLPTEFIYRHFEIVSKYRSPAVPDLVTISFRLYFGAMLAFTSGASGRPGEKNFVSGWARINGPNVEEYTGPLAAYVAKVPATEASVILMAEGANQVVTPGSRLSSELELWVRDYFRREPPARETNGLFWIGGVKPGEETKWFLVDAEDGKARIERRLLPH